MTIEEQLDQLDKKFRALELDIHSRVRNVEDRFIALENRVRQLERTINHFGEVGDALDRRLGAVELR